jgi:hypothetical protein
MWDERARTLRVWTDLFGNVPMYWASTAQGTAFGGGVRGVLMAPGVSTAPDPEAIREAVSFGGYRLGARTNVRDVQMAPWGASMTISRNRCEIARHTPWARLDVATNDDLDELLEQARAAWARAIRRRLEGARVPGITLSGGLDSRAIAAEARRQGARPQTLTFGVAAADDVRFARRAARALDLPWGLYPLYTDGWLARRLDLILPTDGLIQLVDLMHLEALPQMPDMFDTLLSGYMGDVVCAGTYLDADSVTRVLAALPYYGGRAALTPAAASARVAELLAETHGPARFVMYDQKLRQAIARIHGAARPYVRVRRPFIDREFLSIIQRVPKAPLADRRWYERWLRSTYPEAFARIPNQRTGSPPGVSPLRREVVRALRFGWRRSMERLRSAGLPVHVPERGFHPDERHWRKSDARDVIEGTILRPGSLTCEVLGRTAVQATTAEFFDHGIGAIQPIGAMFVYERYHQTLAGFLAAARGRAERVAC